MLAENTEQTRAEAAHIIDKLYLAEPNNPFVIRLVLKGHGKNENVVNLIKGLVEVAEKNSETISLHYLYSRLFKIYKGEGDYEKAKENSLKLLTLNPHNFVALNQLAILSKEEENYEEAIDLLKRSLVENSLNSHSYSQLGIVYTRLFENTGAEKYKTLARRYFEEGRKNCSNNIPLDSAYAQFLATYYRDFETSKQIFEHNLSIDRNHAQSIVGLSKIYSAQGNFQKSKEILESRNKSIKNISRADLGALILSANTYIELEDFNDAKICLHKAFDISPKNWQTDLLLLKVHAALNEWQSFEEVMNRVVSNTVVGFPELTDLANWLLKNKQHEKALEFTNIARSRNNGNYTLQLRTVRANVLFEFLKTEVGKKNRNKTICTTIFEECRLLLKTNIDESTNSIASVNLLTRITKYLLQKKIYDFPENISIRKDYLLYLGKGFLISRNNEQQLVELADYLKDQRRYRLGIYIIINYTNNLQYRPILLSRLIILFDFLGDFQGILKWKNMLKNIAQNSSNLEIRIRTTIENSSQAAYSVGYYNGIEIAAEGKYYQANFETNIISKEVLNQYRKQKIPVKVYFCAKDNKAFNIEPFFDEIPRNDTAALSCLGLLWSN